MTQENIKIAAIYFSPTKKDGEPYYDNRSRTNYNLVTIYEAGKQRDGRKLYGKEFGTNRIMRAWKKGETIAVYTEQSKNGMWNFEVMPGISTENAFLAPETTPVGQTTAKDYTAVLGEINAKLDAILKVLNAPPF